MKDKMKSCDGSGDSELFHCGEVSMCCEINLVKGQFNLPREGLTELHLLVFISTLTLTQHINTWELPCSTTAALWLVAQ